VPSRFHAFVAIIIADAWSHESEAMSHFEDGSAYREEAASVLKDGLSHVDEATLAPGDA